MANLTDEQLKLSPVEKSAVMGIMSRERQAMAIIESLKAEFAAVTAEMAKSRGLTPDQLAAKYTVDAETNRLILRTEPPVDTESDQEPKTYKVPSAKRK